VTTSSIIHGAPLDTDLMLQGRALTLGGFIRDVVDAHPSNEAVVTRAKRLTYAELGAHSALVARALIACGVGAGSRIGLLVPNGPEWIAGFYGATSIGAIVVALNTFASASEIEAMLVHGDVQVLLATEATAGRLGVASGGRDLKVPSLVTVLHLDDPELGKLAEQIDDHIRAALVARVVPDDDAMILFTSGSTGTPKAVLHGHRAICVQSWRWQHFEDRQPTDRVWSTSPFFWTSGLTRTLGSCLAGGATLVIQPRFEPGEALEMLEAERVTAVLSRHHLDHRLLGHPDITTRDLSAIRRIYRNSPLVERLGSLPYTPAGYGMTETMTLVSQSPTGDVEAVDNGVVLPGTSVRIVDVETGEVIPRNVAGRICVRGATLMHGYYKQPREETFDADGWYLTADLGFVDDGGLMHFTGRLDDMVKVAGATVYPAAVERHVAAMGGLLAFSVFAVPHPTTGSALVLCAAPAEPGRGEPAADEQSIDEYLRARLASYQLPRRILLISDSDLTFTASQKVDLTEMRRLGIEMLLGDAAEPDWAEHLRSVGGVGHEEDGWQSPDA
jgi:acyl-CoA synthetase (AMP-forming)/AMP-acid ligase II